MLPAHSLFVNKNGRDVSRVGSAISYRVNGVVWIGVEQESNALYRQIVYQLRRNPERLMFHVQRIYYCFDNKLSEPLYAALTDLFYVLKGQGRALGWRIATEVISVLAVQEAVKIIKHLRKYDTFSLKGNQYTIFTTGCVGSLTVIKEAIKINTEYDVLTLARDYIEYSQLELAMEVLEGGIIRMPRRLELQIELLELYVLTDSYLAYKKMTNQLQNNQIDITNEWQNAANCFAELNNEE